MTDHYSSFKYLAFDRPADRVLRIPAIVAGDFSLIVASVSA